MRSFRDWFQKVQDSGVLSRDGNRRFCSDRTAMNVDVVSGSEVFILDSATNGLCFPRWPEFGTCETASIPHARDFSQSTILTAHHHVQEATTDGRLIGETAMPRQPSRAVGALLQRHQLGQPPTRPGKRLKHYACAQSSILCYCSHD